MVLAARSRYPHTYHPLCTFHCLLFTRHPPLHRLPCGQNVLNTSLATVLLQGYTRVLNWRNLIENFYSVPRGKTTLSFARREQVGMFRQKRWPTYRLLFANPCVSQFESIFHYLLPKLLFMIYRLSLIWEGMLHLVLRVSKDVQYLEMIAKVFKKRSCIDSHTHVDNYVG